jgi:probable addiction module antidote protein
VAGIRPHRKIKTTSALRILDRMIGNDPKLRRRISIERFVPPVSHNKVVIRQLRKDPTLAAEYLNAALEDADNTKTFLLALRHIAEARAGLAKIARRAGIQRESLYRALSPRGNPRLSTLFAVTKAVGLKLSVDAA